MHRMVPHERLRRSGGGAAAAAASAGRRRPRRVRSVGAGTYELGGCVTVCSAFSASVIAATPTIPATAPRPAADHSVLARLISAVAVMGAAIPDAWRSETAARLGSQSRKIRFLRIFRDWPRGIGGPLV